MAELAYPMHGLVVTRTPLRISFAGGGTDLAAFYERDYGAVLSSAVDRYVYVTVKRHGPVFDEKIRLNYSTSESVGEIDAIRNDIARECLRMLEVEPPIYVSIVSDLPDSSGLGGSSCFAVGLLNALHTYKGERVSAGQLAEEAAHVEIDILGQPIGKQDQYAAAFGGMNLLHFQANGDVTVDPIRVSTENRRALFDRILLIWTGHQRRAASVLNAQRAETQDHLDDLIRMREQALALKALMTSDQFDAARFGAILDEGWRMKRRLTSAVSNEHIDAWYECAMQTGALGGKLCGAGGGGFLMFLAEPERHAPITDALGLPMVELGHEANGSRVILAERG
jgi:D-glycero-alpha-D-manno-heptose-7-phosphate kinase